MNIQLSIIKRASDSSLEEVAAVGTVNIESALAWVNEIHEVAGTIHVLDSRLGQLDLQSAIYLPPASERLMKFNLADKESAIYWDYQYDGPLELLDQLVDRITVFQARFDLSQMG